MKEDWSDVAYVRRRLCAAKRRAMYWSGNPSFNYRARAVDRNNEHEFKYELALSDVHSIDCILAKLEGKPAPDRRAYDPKRDFGHKFVKLMGDLSRKRNA